MRETRRGPGEKPQAKISREGFRIIELPLADREAMIASAAIKGTNLTEEIPEVRIQAVRRIIDIHHIKGGGHSYRIEPGEDEPVSRGTTTGRAGYTMWDEDDAERYS